MPRRHGDVDDGRRPTGGRPTEGIKLVATPPIGANNKVNDLAATREGSDYILSWHYRNCGDYNQDGAVKIGDITPLAVHYGEHVHQDNSIQELIDGDDEP